MRSCLVSEAGDSSAANQWSEHISPSPDSSNDRFGIRVHIKFATKSGNLNVDASIVDFARRTSSQIEQLVSSQHPLRMLCKHKQEIEFSTGQYGQRVVCGSEFTPCDIEPPSGKREYRSCWRS